MEGGNGRLTVQYRYIVTAVDGEGIFMEEMIGIGG